MSKRFENEGFVGAQSIPKTHSASAFLAIKRPKPLFDIVHCRHRYTWKGPGVGFVPMVTTLPHVNGVAGRGSKSGDMNVRNNYEIKGANLIRFSSIPEDLREKYIKRYPVFTPGGGTRYHHAFAWVKYSQTGGILDEPTVDEKMKAEFVKDLLAAGLLQEITKSGVRLAISRLKRKVRSMRGASSSRASQEAKAEKARCEKELGEITQYLKELDDPKSKAPVKKKADE